MDNNNFNIIEIEIDKSVSIGNFNTIKGNVKIGKNIQIGNNCTFEGDISIDDNTIIGNNVVILNNVKIGKNNRICSGCIFGYEAQHLSKTEIKQPLIEVGNRNTFRENCTIHKPFSTKKTKIYSNCYFMVNTNIPHDAIIHDNVTIAYNVAIGGHCEIYDYANIGLNVSIHQFVKIGAYSMIGMGSIITKDVLPFYLIYGNSPTIVKLNQIGFERNYKGSGSFEELETIYQNLSNKNKSNNYYNTTDLGLILKKFISKSSTFYI